MKNKKPSCLKASLVCIVVLTFLCGIAYPLMMTGISQLIFPEKANGSQITRVKDGKEELVGSELLGQDWKQPQYLIGRPNPGAPSNRSALSNEQSKVVKSMVKWWHDFDPNTIGKEIPDDLVTIGGSGVDPDISPKAAQFQVSRIARIRNMSEKEVQTIIANNTAYKTFGFLGEERVNVLKVNIALDDYSNNK